MKSVLSVNFEFDTSKVGVEEMEVVHRFQPSLSRRDIRIDTVFGEVRFDNLNQNVGHDPAVPLLERCFLRVLKRRLFVPLKATGKAPL